MIDTPERRGSGDQIAPLPTSDATTTPSWPHKLHALLAMEHGRTPIARFRRAEPQAEKAAPEDRSSFRRLRYGIDSRTGDRTLANQYWDAVRSELTQMLAVAEARRRKVARRR